MDEFLAEQGITKLDILKIDAEGNDMQVLYPLTTTSILVERIFTQKNNLSTHAPIYLTSCLIYVILL